MTKENQNSCFPLADDGYNVDYLRVPVTDEKAPKPDDFGVLIDRAWQPPPGAALVFNCQMVGGSSVGSEGLGLHSAALSAIRLSCGACQRTGAVAKHRVRSDHQASRTQHPLPEWQGDCLKTSHGMACRDAAARQQA